jgi:hypothetical protein
MSISVLVKFWRADFLQTCTAAAALGFRSGKGSVLSTATTQLQVQSYHKQRGHPLRKTLKVSAWDDRTPPTHASTFLHVLDRCSIPFQNG